MGMDGMGWDGNGLHGMALNGNRDRRRDATRDYTKMVLWAYMDRALVRESRHAHRISLLTVQTHRVDLAPRNNRCGYGYFQVFASFQFWWW